MKITIARIEEIGLFIIILSGLKLFIPTFISVNIINILFDLSALVIIGLTVLYLLTNKTGSKIFSSVFKFYSLGLLFSTICASMFWEQSIFITLTSLSPFYYLYIYFAIRLVKPSKNFVIGTIVLLGFAHALIVVMNKFLFQDIIFGFRAVESYGEVIKTTVPGRSFLYLLYFFVLHKTLEEKIKITNSILIVLFLVLFLLMGRRVMLVSLIISSIYIYLNTTKKQSTAIIIPVVTVIFLVFSVYFLFYEFWFEMVGATTSQVANISDYVRVLSAQYYLTDFQPNTATQLLGNGFPSTRSSYGIFIQENLWVNYGFYMADIGLAGFYTMFGLFGICSFIIMFIKSIIHSSSTIFTAFFIFFIFMAFFNKEIYSVDTLIAYSLLMYLIERKYSDLEKVKYVFIKNTS